MRTSAFHIPVLGSVVSMAVASMLRTVRVPEEAEHAVARGEPDEADHLEGDAIAAYGRRQQKPACRDVDAGVTTI
jgi:hypothetical protein